MQWVVTKQVAVEAETVEEAVAKAGSGQTIALTVNVRPTMVIPAPQPMPPRPVVTTEPMGAGQAGQVIK